MARVEAVNHVGWAVQRYVSEKGWISVYVTTLKDKADHYCSESKIWWPHREFRVYEEVSDVKL